MKPVEKKEGLSGAVEGEDESERLLKFSRPLMHSGMFLTPTDTDSARPTNHLIIH